MSFLRRLFGGDPEHQLQRGRKAFDAGQAAEALDLFRRVQEGAGERTELAEQAVAGIVEASGVLVDLNLREADLCHEAGDLEAAVGHLQTALELAPDDQLRSRVQLRMGSLQDAMDAADEPQALFNTDGAVGEDDLPELEWERLLATLVDEVAEEYRDRDDDYRDAVLALNAGSVREAAEALEVIRDGDPDDPLVHLELGRAYLSMERFEDAVRELAVARNDIGFDPIDRMGLMQVGQLEAEALLGDGHLEKARALLEEAVEDQGENVVLMHLRGRIEHAMGDHEAVEATYGRVTTLAPQLVEGAMVLGESRLQRGEVDAAVDVLEAGIKRHCGTGTCQVRPVSAPAARLLVGAYMQQGAKLDRAEDLLLQVRGAQEGHITWSDHVLWGRLHKARGNGAALSESRAAALAVAPEEPPEIRERIRELLGES